jgi:preprotein translocase subunit YajC
MIFVVYLAILAVLFFVLIVLPQRRQLSARRSLVASLEVGDRIITAGGVYGTVRELDDETIELEVAEGVQIRIARQAVNSRVSELPEKPAAEPGADAAGDVVPEESAQESLGD